jgi:23S rRNA (pseudouridine1915-N3)-methyltransferase
MNIKLIQVGKTEESYLNEGILKYQKRLKHYVNFEEKTLKGTQLKGNMAENEVKKSEGAELLKQIGKSEKLILLDEKGKTYSSAEFASFLQREANSSTKNLVFVIGGPFGFSDDLYKRADGLLSFSKMTYSHQMIRLFFWEQLYRGFTILKGEKYHHI